MLTCAATAAIITAVKKMSCGEKKKQIKLKLTKRKEDNLHLQCSLCVEYVMCVHYKTNVLSDC